MIKLQIEDATLATLDPALIPFVHWKALKVSDLEGVSEEILSKYLFKLAQPVMKSVIKNNRVNVSNVTHDEWISIINEAYSSDYDISKYVQLPYSVIQYFITESRNKSYWSQRFALTQKNMPVMDALKNMSPYSINELLSTNTNPALRDFMLSDEGLSILKKDFNINFNSVVLITSKEAEKLNVGNFYNVEVSLSSLGGSRACDTGRNYFRRIMSELGRDSITWDEIIELIRKDDKFMNRPNLQQYVYWIHEHRSAIHRYNNRNK